jgi:hypothetical protein
MSSTVPSGGGSGAVRGRCPASTGAVRSTNSTMSPAFHEPQAAGPVASESASVRAASSSSVVWLPTAAATEEIVASSARSRRVAVSARRR